MPDSPITVRDVFELPQPNTPQEESPRWQSLRDWMSKEVSSMKRGTIPDLTTKVAELLEVPIPDILLTSWKKTNVLRELLEESRKSPETAVYLELGEHTINSQHRPHIEVRVKKMPVKKLEFSLRLVFNLKGFILKVQNGAVTELQTGSCEMKGSLEFQGLAVAEKKLAPIKLPGRIPLEAMRGFWATEQPQAAAATTGVATAAAATGTRVVADSPSVGPTSAPAKQVVVDSASLSKPAIAAPIAAPAEPKPVATAPPAPAPAAESKPAPHPTVETKPGSTTARSEPPVPPPTEPKSASAAAAKSPAPGPPNGPEEREEIVL